MLDKSPDQWLIRTAENRITGPYTRQEVCQLIQQGKLKQNDEVCHGNRYWFYLHEQQELKNQLGVDVPKGLFGNPEESTQTEIDEAEEELERTDPELELQGTRVATLSTTAAAQIEIVEVPGEMDETTAVMSNTAFRAASTPVPAPTPVIAPASLQSASPVLEAVQQPERGRARLAKVLMYLMVIGAIGLLFFVIKLLKEQPSG